MSVHMTAVDDVQAKWEEARSRGYVLRGVMYSFGDQA